MENLKVDFKLNDQNELKRYPTWYVQKKYKFSLIKRLAPKLSLTFKIVKNPETENK